MSTRLLAVAGAVLMVGAGCSSSGTSDPDAGKNAATATTCVKDATGKKVTRPDRFPNTFPLPAGTVLTGSEDRGKDGVVITGVTGTDFAAVLRGLQTQLPAKAFTPSEGEVEPHDAESNWASAGYTGRWAIRELERCAGDVSVQVVARPKA